MRYLLLLVLVGASRASTFPCAPGIDYPDGDLPNMPLPLPFIGGNASSEALCAAMCVAEPACVASVTLDPGCAGGGVSAALCYLKGTQTPAKQQPCRCGAPLSRAPVPSAARSAQRFAITTPHVAATFDARGLLSVTVDGVSLSVQADTFALALDAGVVVNSSQLPDPAGSQPTPSSVQLVYSSPPYTITVLYEVRAADWRFLRKALSVAAAGGGAIAVGSVSPWDVLALTAESALAGAVFPTGTLGTYGVFGRFADGTGIALVAENPFLYPSLAPAFSAGGALAHVGYHPALLWNQTTPSDPTPRPFVADAGLLGLYALSPNAVPPAVEANAASPRFAPAAYRRPAATAATDTNAGMLVEFEAFAGGGGALPAGVHLHFGAPADASWLNYAERDAFRAMGEAAFAAAHGGGAKPLRVHIPWTENDYQIDISNATQWAEYVRILTQLSRMDVPRLLYAGGNGAVSSVADCEDDWCWENVLWLNYGEALREGRWAPGSPVAESVAQLVQLSAALGVSAIPYVYPILGFTANRTSPPPPWLSPEHGNSGKVYAQLSNREFQDYFIDTTVAFSRAMGAHGAGYDYTYFWYAGASQYSQWAGWRRVLLEVRAALSGPGAPHHVVDNRQASHEWSPWMWAAGSYAEPLQSDEQTTSWEAYVQDVHIDRGDANRQRQMNYDYAQSKLCQPSAMPGFFHHNIDRGDGRRVDLTIRDFDFYAGPYAVLSAIATGGLNLVVCDVAARDEGEFAAFPAAAPDNTTLSLDFYRRWFRWAEAQQEHLRAVKFLPQPPAPGAIDGTYAVVNGSGFLFLFNPNPEAAATPSGLLTASAASLDLTACAPGGAVTVGELWPAPAPALLTVPCGANFSLAVEGRNARVLTLAPAAPGDAAAAAAESARRAAPPLFVHSAPVAGMGYNASFAGGPLVGAVRVPGAVLAQLAARAAAYPVAWTPDDAPIPWLNPARLIATVDVNRALPSTAVITATLDGAAVPVVPAWSCRTVRRESCFQGFFIDLTAAGVVEADRDYTLVVNLPQMKAGAFGGVHYDNVDTV